MNAKFKKVIRLPRMMLWAFLMESVETKRMLQTFALKGQERLLVRTPSKVPTEEEMRQALAQLKDLPRFLPFFVLVVAPVPGITEGYVLLAVTLEKWLGHRVSLLPSHFRKVFQKEAENAGEKPP